MKKMIKRVFISEKPGINMPVFYGLGFCFCFQMRDRGVDMVNFKGLFVEECTI